MRILTILFLTIILSFSAFAQSKNDLKMAEQFAATSIDGDKFDLAALKGKVVFITFWGTYCPICISEIPEFNEMAAHYKDKDVVFLAISAENEAKLKPFLKKNPFKFNQIPNGFEIMAKYADKSANGSFRMPTPMNIIINQNGEIEIKMVGRDTTKKLQGTLERLLKEKS